MNFLIAVPGADDIMLNYQSLSHHDVLRLRHLLGLRPAPEFERWLQSIGLMDNSGRVPDLPPSSPSLQKLIAARDGG